MKKSLLAVLIAAAFVMSACGTTEKAQEETSAEASTETETEAATEAATEAVTEAAVETEAQEEAEAEAGIDSFTGLWATGENEDTTYLLIGEETWSQVPGDDESEEPMGGMVELNEDSLDLYNGEDVYNTVFFGAEEDTLYSSQEYQYTLVCRGYNGYTGIWVTGENEDTTAIAIYGDLTWQVLNLDEIEGFEEVGGYVIAAEDSLELYDDEGLYNTVYFGAEEDTLYSAEGYTYTRDEEMAVEDLDEFVGVWQTGENEDLSYLVICDDYTWKLLPADDVEGADEVGGTVSPAEDCIELYEDGELYSAVYFGAEENTLYSSLGYTCELVSRDYNEIGD